jgi:alkanesulfonate monooxygenase SsuD/methylene tetrahydromethanopterin reductase-like flavin-dependent oxidoreductase (luciferase family)
VVRPAVELGATAAGRDPADVSVTTSVILQLGENQERNRFEAALQIGFYATTRTYAPVLALHGFEDRVAPLREAYASGDAAKLAELAMPMVDTYAITGSAEECRERLASFDGLVDRIILGGAWVGPDPASLAANIERVLEAFAPGA